jgi:hypothetical protein
MKMGCEWTWLSVLVDGFCINNSELSNPAASVVGWLVSY